MLAFSVVADSINKKLLPLPVENTIINTCPLSIAITFATFFRCSGSF
jgi:hypothetical protein